MYACQSNTICSNENTIINKEKNIECCKLICTVYLRCLFKYEYYYLIYYVCIIQ